MSYVLFMSIDAKTVQFIEKAKQVHGDLFDYGEFLYHGTQKKGIIICRIHGAFEKTPLHHIQRAQGCPECTKVKRSHDRLETIETFVEKARKVHGDLYDYNGFVYVNSQTKSTLRCTRHDINFEQTSAHHLSGNGGCPECAKIKSKETQIERYGVEHSKSPEFNEKVKQTSLERFGVEHRSKASDFRETMRQSTLDRHGVEFASQLPEFRERVRQTNLERYGVEHALQLSEYKEKVRKTNLERYGVGNVLQIHIPPPSLEILNNKELLIQSLEMYSVRELADILGIGESAIGRYCRNHGIDLPSSTYETAIAGFLREHGIECYLHDRKIIAPQEIDILIPDHKLGIEFGGIFWHNEHNISDSNYHLNKLVRMKDAGYRLITIFEDEWLHHRDIVEARLLHLLGKSTRGKGARQLAIKPISVSDTIIFLNRHHIQGAGSNGYAKYGAFDGDILVAVMTFSRPRVALGRTTGADELLRFATDGKSYPGIASRLFKIFLREHNPTSVVSYADRRWSDGNLYARLGFTFVHETTPNYWYIDYKNSMREYRFKYRKDQIKHLVEDGDQKTERQIMLELGRDRIWDCGSLKYEWSQSIG